jgi:PEP-CTERM motif
MLRRLLTLTICVPGLVLSLTVPARASGFFFDFNNQSDAGLTRYDPLAAFGQGGTYSFPQLSPGNFGYQLTQEGVPADNLPGPARMGSAVTGQTFGGVAESVDVVNFDPSLGQSFGLGTRVQTIGLGTTSGYALAYSTPSAEGTTDGEFTFTRVTNELSTDIGTVTDLTLQAGHAYRIQLLAVGSTLTGQLFDLTDMTLLATATAIDSTYATGAAGVIVAAPLPGSTSGLNVTFDNLLVQSVPEPSSLTLLGIGFAVAGLWTAHRQREPMGPPRSSKPRISSS